MVRFVCAAALVLGSLLGAARAAAEVLVKTDAGGVGGKDPEEDIALLFGSHQVSCGVLHQAFADALTVVIGVNVEVVEQVPVGGGMVGENAAETGELVVGFGNGYVHGVVVVGEAVGPYLQAFGGGFVVEVMVGEGTAVGSLPT